jgi:hypothetical protein
LVENIFKYTKLSDHAFTQMQKRFPDKAKNRQAAETYVLHLLKNSEYIGIVCSEFEEEDVHMYSYKSTIVILVNLSYTKVVTLYDVEEKDITDYIPFRPKIEKIYKTEFRKLHRTERSLLRKIESTSIKNDMEIGILRYKKFKTRSQNVKKECDSRIKKLEEEKKSLDSELKKTKRIKMKVAFALATKRY